MQDQRRGVTLGIVDMLHQMNGLGGGYPGAAGRVTLSAGTGRWCHPGRCGHETSGTESGCWLILETVDMIPCMCLGGSHPGYYRNLAPGRVKREVTLETVYL